jgi:hypothetical protein
MNECAPCQARAMSQQNNSGTYVPPVVPQTCDYTLNSLKALLPLITAGETSLVQSQINTYSNNCHYFRAIVFPLFNKYAVQLDL